MYHTNTARNKYLIAILLLFIIQINSEAKESNNKNKASLRASDIAAFLNVYGYTSIISLKENSYQIEIIEFDNANSESVIITSKPLVFSDTKEVLKTYDTSLALIFKKNDDGHYRIMITERGRASDQPITHDCISKLKFEYDLDRPSDLDRPLVAGLPSTMTYGTYVFIGIRGSHNPNNMFSRDGFTKGIALKISPIKTAFFLKSHDNRYDYRTEQVKVNLKHKNFMRNVMV